jgi:hypothetical protein
LLCVRILWLVALFVLGCSRQGAPASPSAGSANEVGPPESVDAAAAPVHPTDGAIATKLVSAASDALENLRQGPASIVWRGGHLDRIGRALADGKLSLAEPRAADILNNYTLRRARAERDAWQVVIVWEQEWCGYAGPRPLVRIPEPCQTFGTPVALGGGRWRIPVAGAELLRFDQTAHCADDLLLAPGPGSEVEATLCGVTKRLVPSRHVGEAAYAWDTQEALRLVQRAARADPSLRVDGSSVHYNGELVDVPCRLMSLDCTAERLGAWCHLGPERVVLVTGETKASVIAAPTSHFGLETCAEQQDLPLAFELPPGEW